MQKVRCKCRSSHLCVPVEVVLRMLLKGENILNCSPEQALKELTAQEATGKKYFAGCDNETSEGRCGGHQEHFVNPCQHFPQGLHEGMCQLCVHDAIDAALVHDPLNA